MKNLHIAMTTIGTNEILKSVEHEEIYYFWDDFLGNADFVDETPSPSFDDRIFSTGMAINALLGNIIVSSSLRKLDIWTIRREYEGIVNLEFIENTPAKVSATIYGASYWLKDQSHLFPRENAVKF